MGETLYAVCLNYNLVFQVFLEVFLQHNRVIDFSVVTFCLLFRVVCLNLEIFPKVDAVF